MAFDSAPCSQLNCGTRSAYRHPAVWEHKERLMALKPAHRFQEFINACSSATPVLPAMHTCFGRGFIQIMESGVITTGKLDPIIGKQASFFFYGKPSYRPKSDGRSSSTLWSALFTFILDYNTLPCPASMLPFDSGGYEKFYRDICEDTEIAEYYLPEQKETPARVVDAFFGDNASYYEMAVRGDLSNRISKLDFHSDSLKQICSPNNKTTYDQRAASIEMHFIDPIILTPDNVLAIVGPHTALEEAEVIAFAGRLGAERVPYDLDHDHVDARQRQVRDVTRSWLKSENYIT
jgi:hypothetical protein